MGSQQSTVSILTQDSEFDDIFARHAMKEQSVIHYLVGDKEKFEGDALKAKQSLLKYMNMPPIEETSTLLTNGDGVSKTEDIEKFTKIVKNDLKCIVDTEGFTVQLLLTGQCAPLIKIICNLLREKYISPAKVEIFLVNGKHNGQGLLKELIELKRITYDNAAELVIREFNAFSSMGPNAKLWISGQTPVDCGTSKEFGEKIFELAKGENEFAKGIIDYGMKFNASLVAKSGKKISEAVKSLDELNIEHKLGKLSNEVNSYVDKLFENSVLNIELCQRLSGDFQKLVDVVDEELKKINDNEGKDVKDRKGKLFRIRGWFSVKAGITKANLVQFPFHDMSLPLMYTGDNTLVPFVSYGTSMGEFLNIVKDKPITPYVELLHYVSKSPEQTRSVIETMILAMIQ